MNFQVLWWLLQSNWCMKDLNGAAGEEQNFLYQDNKLTKASYNTVHLMLNLIVFI